MKTKSMSVPRYIFFGLMFLLLVSFSREALAEGEMYKNSFLNAYMEFDSGYAYEARLLGGASQRVTLTKTRIEDEVSMPSITLTSEYNAGNNPVVADFIFSGSNPSVYFIKKTAGLGCNAMNSGKITGTFYLQQAGLDGSAGTFTPLFLGHDICLGVDDVFSAIKVTDSYVYMGAQYAGVPNGTVRRYSRNGLYLNSIDLPASQNAKKIMTNGNGDVFVSSISGLYFGKFNEGISASYYSFAASYLPLRNFDIDENGDILLAKGTSIIKVDGSDGSTQKWSYVLPAYYDFHAVKAAGNYVFAGGTSGLNYWRLAKLDAQSGAPLWTRYTNITAYPSTFHLEGEKLYVHADIAAGGGNRIFCDGACKFKICTACNSVTNPLASLSLAPSTSQPLKLCVGLPSEPGCAGIDRGSVATTQWSSANTGVLSFTSNTANAVANGSTTINARDTTNNWQSYVVPVDTTIPVTVAPPSTLKICTACTDAYNDLSSSTLIVNFPQQYKACRVPTTTATCNGEDITSALATTWTSDNNSIATVTVSDGASAGGLVLPISTSGTAIVTAMDTSTGLVASINVDAVKMCTYMRCDDTTGFQCIAGSTIDMGGTSCDSNCVDTSERCAPPIRSIEEWREVAP